MRARAAPPTAPKRFSGSTVVLRMPSLLSQRRLPAAIRVAVVRDDDAAAYYDSPGTLDSITRRWRDLLTPRGADAEIVRPVQLRRSDARVIVVPSSPCLTLDTREAIEMAGARGQGLIVSGAVGTHDGGCRPDRLRPAHRSHRRVARGTAARTRDGVRDHPERGAVVRGHSARRADSTSTRPARSPCARPGRDGVLQRLHPRRRARAPRAVPRRGDRAIDLSRRARRVFRLRAEGRGVERVEPRGDATPRAQRGRVDGGPSRGRGRDVAQRPRGRPPSSRRTSRAASRTRHTRSIRCATRESAARTS